jgi:hypothetical protein
MMLNVSTETTKQSVLENAKPLSGCPSLTKLLAESTCRRSPKCFEIDMSIGELARRESEKRKRSAGFEVNSDDEDLFRGLRHEAAPMST